MCLGRQCRVEVSRNNSRRQVDPKDQPLRTFQLFYTLLCPFACEVMVMAIMIMRFMWNRKKVAITGVKRTIAIQLPCTFIHPGSIVHPLYFATTVEPLLIGTLLKSLSFLAANQSRLHFHLIQPPFPLRALLIGCDPKKVFFQAEVLSDKSKFRLLSRISEPRLITGSGRHRQK